MKIPDGYIEHPKHASIKEIKSEYSLGLRQKMGMTCREDIKPVQVLSTEYVKTPRYYSQNQMAEEKRKEMLRKPSQKSELQPYKQRRKASGAGEVFNFPQPNRQRGPNYSRNQRETKTRDQ